MELRVESAQGFTLPKNCFIGVRVGDVLKQGRYEPQRCYNFPQLDRRRNAKVDIYQHVGTCMVAVDPDTKATHEVAVSNLDPETPAGRIRISVQAMSEENKQQREHRTKALKVQARDYLMRHSIEERLSEAVKALLKEQPADPTAFLCKHLQDGDKASHVEEGAPGQKPEQPNVYEDESVNRLRQDAREAFIKASDNGHLESTLSGLQQARSQGSTEKAKNDKEELRNRVSNLLTSSAENGELEKALSSVMKEGMGSMSKEKYIESLRDRAEDGQEQYGNNASDAEILRQEAQKLLISSMEDGTLDKILTTVLKDGANKKEEQLHAKVAKMLRSVPEEDLELATEQVMKGLNDAERAKIYAAIEKLQAGKGKHDLRITVAELLLAAPENDMEKSIDRVMQELSPAEKQKIADAIDKLEAKGGKDALRVQIAEMILAVPEKDLEKTLTSVMQDLSAPARAKILQAIEKVEAKEEKEELRFAVLRLLRAGPEKDLEKNLAAVMKDVSASEREKIRDAILKIEAGDKKDALRIKLAELMLKAPNDGGQAAAAVMKDLSASDRKKILDAIDHLEGRKVGGKDALASMAADLLVTAAENGQLESALTEVLQEAKEDKAKEEIKEKVQQLMRAADEKAVADVMKELTPKEKEKIQQALDKLEDMQEAAAEAEAENLALKFRRLMKAAPEKEIPTALAAMMKDLSHRERSKIQEAVWTVQAGNGCGEAELMAQSLQQLMSSATNLESSLVTVLKEQSPTDRAKIQEALALLEADERMLQGRCIMKHDVMNSGLLGVGMPSGLLIL